VEKLPTATVAESTLALASSHRLRQGGGAARLLALFRDAPGGAQVEAETSIRGYIASVFQRGDFDPFLMEGLRTGGEVGGFKGKS